MDNYHDDPCVMPSLSSSIAKILWSQSPLHAWYAHPRLNPNYVREEKAVFDLGSAAHDVLLEGGTGKIQIIDAADWRTKAAKEARDEAYSKGDIPLLAHQVVKVKEMTDAALDFIASTELSMVFTNATKEHVLTAEYKGIWIRSKLDILSADRKIICDYKTCSGSANPSAFARQALWSNGYDLQAAFYSLINYLTGGPEESAYIWIVQESNPPYCCSLVGATPALMEIGEHRVEYCVKKWKECLDTNVWPAYSNKIAFPDVPAWVLMQTQEMLYDSEEQAL